MHRVRNLAAFAAKRQKPPTARDFVRRGVFQQKPCRVEFVYWVAQIRIYRVAVVGGFLGEVGCCWVALLRLRRVLSELAGVCKACQAAR